MNRSDYTGAQRHADGFFCEKLFLCGFCDGGKWQKERPSRSLWSLRKSLCKGAQ